jgi:hypothetical protein
LSGWFHFIGSDDWDSDFLELLDLIGDNDGHFWGNNFLGSFNGNFLGFLGLIGDNNWNF